MNHIKKSVRINYTSFIGAVFLCGALPSSALAADITVNNAGELNSALQTAGSGDTIILNDGNYNGNFNINSGGSQNGQLTIRAANQGEAEFNNKITVNARYVTLDGLHFIGAGRIDAKQADFVLRNSSFFNSTATDWFLGNQNMRNSLIENNRFEFKNNKGNMIWLRNSNNSLQNTVVRGNYFKRFDSGGGANGWETLKLGLGSESGTGGFTIENNLFEDANGERENISVKCGDNIVRHNVFLDSSGEVVFRRGENNQAYGNYFIRDDAAEAGGIRIQDRDNKIFNNYFENLPGFAIMLMEGNTDQSVPHYKKVVNAQIVHNTIVNSGGAFEVGQRNAFVAGGTSLPPENSTISNNVVVDTDKVFQFAEFTPVNFTYQGNIRQNSPWGDLNPGGFITSNPQFQNSTINGYQLKTPGGGSPVINGAIGTFAFLTDDLFGNPRNTPDVGAIEVPFTPQTIQPVSASDVGPSLGGGNTVTQRIEAEDYDTQNNTALLNKDGGTVVEMQGGTARYNNVDFGTGVSSVDVRVASQAGNSLGTVELSVDDGSGATVVGSVAGFTGSWTAFQTKTMAISNTTGVNDLVLNAPAGWYRINWLEYDYTPSSGGGNPVTERVQAEDYDTQNNTALLNKDGGTVVEMQGGTARYNNVNFGGGVSSVKVRVASQAGNSLGTVQLSVDDGSGTSVVGSVAGFTGSWTAFQTKTMAISNTTGVNDLLLDAPAGWYRINWFEFTRP